MTASMPIGDEADTSRRPTGTVSRATNVILTICAVVAVFVADEIFSALDAFDPVRSFLGETWMYLGAYAAIANGISMIWRRKFPWRVYTINLVLAVLFPLSPAGTLLALTWVIPIANRLQTVAAVAGGALVTALSLWHDWARPAKYSLFSNRDPVVENLAKLPAYGYVLMGIGFLVVAFGVGLIRKYRMHMAVTEQRVRDTEQVASSLRGEINRQEEREQIARDMHDTIAHELSVIALHASALEVAAPDDETREGVKAVRRSANRGLSELRSIIGNLRDGDTSGYRGPQPSISGLRNIVDESRRAGVRIQDVIEVRGAENLAATVSNGIYRIVQESVTNAIRHAPDSPITVSVIGGPFEGIKVIVASWLANEPKPSQGAGSGITGMQERARALGGDLMASAENGMWVVRANLPWRAIEDGGQ